MYTASGEGKIIYLRTDQYWAVARVGRDEYRVVQGKLGVMNYSIFQMCCWLQDHVPWPRPEELYNKNSEFYHM